MRSCAEHDVGSGDARLYLPLIPLFPIPFVDGYRAIAWISWVGNLAVAELYLRGAFSRRGTPVTA